MLVSESTDHLEIPNDNFDTGYPTEPNKYLGADLAYDQLLGKLAKKKFAGVTVALRDNILKYYDTRKAPVEAKDEPKISPRKAEKMEAKALANWTNVVAEVEQLREFQVGEVVAK
jgi:hypothetical protein